ncbi:MAG: phosphoribosylanthranilate isomerase [Acidobacteriota bacterium]|nr:phosphoribosylanthranilate isomerase [Acidobacteriota bacterium]
MRPRVKICGVTCDEDVDAVLAVGADYVGLNFYRPSPRYVDVETAARLRRRIGDRAGVVGVVVDAPVDELRSLTELVGPDLLQFHGTESPEDLAPFAERAIKVFRVSDRFSEAELTPYDGVWGFLFDSGRGRGLGGTGVPWSYEAVAGLGTDKGFFVAGGVGPDNVAEVCARSAPWGIDLCSSVESEPGRKDPALLERLIEELNDVEDATTA